MAVLRIQEPLKRVMVLPDGHDSGTPTFPAWNPGGPLRTLPDPFWQRPRLKLTVERVQIESGAIIAVTVGTGAASAEKVVVECRPDGVGMVPLVDDAGVAHRTAEYEILQSRCFSRLAVDENALRAAVGTKRTTAVIVASGRNCHRGITLHVKAGEPIKRKWGPFLFPLKHLPAKDA